MWKSDVPERGINGRPGADSSSSHVRSTQVYAQVAEPSCWKHAHRARSVRTYGLGGTEFCAAGTWEIHCFRISECIVRIGSILIGGAAGFLEHQGSS